VLECTGVAPCLRRHEARKPKIAAGYRNIVVGIVEYNKGTHP
jgi:hypothetical protein